MSKHKTAKPPTELEHKTTWATTAAGVFSALVAYVVANPNALDFAPKWAQALAVFIVGTGAIGKAAYQAPHTARSDVAPVGTLHVKGKRAQTDKVEAPAAVDVGPH